jgi:alkanesulfonate monooxygenase SsuD/methylene tetrahydromethanopterin reductase-like flavin-dependent oxidoreductase (luciferase family)
MKFSIYSEMQYVGGKSWGQLHDEVAEQVINADRLGYDAYTVIADFCFPKFSISPDRMAFFAACAQRTKHVTFRSLVHIHPYSNPTVLASRIAAADILLDGHYEFGVGWGHGWIPPKTGVRLDEACARYQGCLELLILALEHERRSSDGTSRKLQASPIVPHPPRRFRLFLGGINDQTYVLAGQRGWAIVVPPPLPYETLRAPLDLYRTACITHGHLPDITWIHACYLDADRHTARREAEQGMRNLLRSRPSPLTEAQEMAPARLLAGAGSDCYASGVMEPHGEIPPDGMIDHDVVWIGMPHDIIERMEAVQALCEGVTEIAIIVNGGGLEHWQSIKAQELFAHYVIPHFRSPGVEAGEKLMHL